MLAQTSSSGPSTAYSLGALLVFLVAVFAIGFGIARFQKARHQRAWRPLLPMVGGTVASGIGPGSSVMRGTHRGRTVIATATPGSSLGPSDDATVRYNRFVVRLFGVEGAGAWRVMPGRDGWVVKTDDHDLGARLHRAGVIALAEELRLPQDDPLPGLAFDPKERFLELNADAGDAIVPTLAGFEALLGALDRLTAMNTATNPSSTP